MLQQQQNQPNFSSPRPYRPIALSPSLSSANSSPNISPPPQIGTTTTFSSSTTIWADVITSRQDGPIPQRDLSSASNNSPYSSIPNSPISCSSTSPSSLYETIPPLPGSEFSSPMLNPSKITSKSPPPTQQPPLLPPPVGRISPTTSNSQPTTTSTTTTSSSPSNSTITPTIPEELLGGLPISGGSITVIDELPSFFPKSYQNQQSQQQQTYQIQGRKRATTTSTTTNTTNSSPFGWQNLKGIHPPLPNASIIVAAAKITNNNQGNVTQQATTITTATRPTNPNENENNAYVMSRPSGPPPKPPSMTSAALPIPSRRATFNGEILFSPNSKQSQSQSVAPQNIQQQHSIQQQVSVSLKPEIVPNLNLSSLQQPHPIKQQQQQQQQKQKQTQEVNQLKNPSELFSLFSNGHNMFPSPPPLSPQSPNSPNSPQQLQQAKQTNHSTQQQQRTNQTLQHEQQQQLEERRHRFLSSPSAVRKLQQTSPPSQSQTTANTNNNAGFKISTIAMQTSFTTNPNPYSNPSGTPKGQHKSALSESPDEDQQQNNSVERDEELSPDRQPPPASRQRVKQLLKRLKLESTPSANTQNQAKTITTSGNSNSSHNNNSSNNRGGNLKELIAMFTSNENMGGNDRWLIILELADMSKREGDLESARMLFHKAIKMKPHKNQSWLEYAKMEEENGQLEHCRNILKRGLQQCPFCEVLMIKAIKTEEKLGCIAGAHAILSHLKDQPLEKTWRTVLEGALLESRIGNIEVARNVFHYLMRNVPWCGPIFQEACRFEERSEEFDRALLIAEEGLRNNPKYGPLWFCLLRLYERIAFEKLHSALQNASEVLLRDLRWKVHFEWSQIESRANNIDEARREYLKAAENAPSNLEWKVWFGGSRTELSFGNIEIARNLILRSLTIVPLKMKPAVILEQARLEEYAGNFNVARQILDDGKIKAEHEWKVFLERVLLEIRACDNEAALIKTREALLVHSGTGRLWAVYIQLKRYLGLEEQSRVFQRALHEVPKSGEVWCEGARIYIGQKKYSEARDCLAYAAQFTPQYGDTFIEELRNELEETGKFIEPCPLEQVCINAEPNYGPLWLFCKKHPLDTPLQVLRNAREILYNAMVNKEKSLDYKRFNDVNEMYHASRSLPNEERLKLVFGSDQVKS